MALTWAQALGWRLRRQLLDPVGTGSVVDVVRRLGAVPAWPDATAELAIGMRRAGGQYGDAARALATDKVVKVFAYRGALHLMAPEDAGDHLALRASSRMWERPSWVEYYGLAPSDWPRFREFVRETLADGPLKHAELVSALRRDDRYRRVATALAEGNDTVLKPLTWQGDMCLGSGPDGEVAFLRSDSVPGWGGVPDVEEAGPRVLAAYFRTYGPAPANRVYDWFGKGLGVGRRRLTRWLGELSEQHLVAVTIEGDEVLVLRDDLDELLSARPSEVVRLLPGRDPWVMAPGTSDARVVPPRRREVVSRSANLVVRGGVVAGTWALRGGDLVVTWFDESGPASEPDVGAAAAQLAEFLGRPLDLVLQAG